MPRFPRSVHSRRGAFILGLAILAASVTLPSVTGAVATPSSASARQAAEEVISLLTKDDADMRRVALETVRQGLHGEWFTTMLAASLPSLDPAGQEALLLALADRGDPIAVPAATTMLAGSKDALVRAAAVRLLGQLGGPTTVAAIVSALAADGPERDAARRALVELTGPEAAAAVRAAAGSGEAATRRLVIDAMAERRDRAALPILVTAAVDTDTSVREAAMRALARFGGPAEVPAMIDSLLKSSGDERKGAELAIASVCTTGSKAGEAVSVVIDRYSAADEQVRQVMLPALARIGGPQVMAIVDAMLADPASRARGLDALAKWPDATVKDRLLDLLGKTTDAKEKELLLGTLIRIAPLPDNKLTDVQKLDLLVKTMALCERPEDRARVLERANAIRTVETFRFVVPYLDDPTLAEPACRSVVELAHHQKLRDAHKAEFMAALDKVLGITKNEELVERATRYKAGQTWDRKKKG